ncbi:MAG: hypothetical protein KAX39_01405 [candidate division Zixibacteria bacterium]|nr:hypothetical protein [candidate division Zixibacteria bacterium]
MPKPLILQTGVSQAFWCTPRGNFEEAKIPIMSGSGNGPEIISWFDKLLEGGIHLRGRQADENRRAVESDGRKPLTFLITGPPESGKSTLSMELCYRLTRNKQIDGTGLFTLYVSTEADAKQIQDNAESFGWEVTGRILSFDQKAPPAPAVAVWGTDKIKSGKELSEIVQASLEALGKVLSVPAAAKVVGGWVDRILRWNKVTGKVERVTPDILVIDSLNILEPSKRSEFFKEFLKVGSYSPRIIIFVLDSGSSDKAHEFWEYVCDNVVRLDYEYSSGYYLRRMEIVKARYQPHTWGRHQLKIYPPFHQPQETGSERIKKIRRAHPYRKEGGVFIFPSIHYYLSVYKRLGPTKPPKTVKTSIESLDKVLNGGLPEGRCTALIGARGGHKSHLGYLHLLSGIINRNEAGLVISLRDDEGMTEKTMGRILEQEFPQEKRNLSHFERDDKLEALYYPPGNITPEEFFHRMFMSIHRLKSNSRKLTVLFNSLDQLSARFPLCAKEEIFVPGIIESLSGEGITSIFVAVEEPGQPAEQYGLLPMTDLILSFELRRFPFEHYYQHLNTYWKLEKKSKSEKLEKIKKNSKGSYHDAVVLRVIRFAGGQRAGACGLLELVDEKDIRNFLYETPGLHFTPLNPKFPFGKCIGEAK